MGLRRKLYGNWLWSAAALVLVLVALAPTPASARQYRTSARISVSSTGVQGINIQHPVINADGTVVAFWSDREGLVPGDTNFAGDVFVRRVNLNQTLRVSLGFGGVQTARTDGNLPNSYPDIDISDSGCIVVYSSDAHNIIQVNGTAVADNNFTTDVFAVDWCVTGFPTNTTQTLHVSRNYGTGQQSNGGNTNPKISGNGCFILWRSNGNNLVPGDLNNQPDIFIMDRCTAGFPISRVNLANGSGAEANVEDGTSTFSVSDNGFIVAFASIATNLTGAPDGNPYSDIFIRNRPAGTTIRINGVGGAAPNGPSYNPHISGNGQFVAFRSDASNLVPNDNNGHADIFVYEIATGAIEKVSRSSEGGTANFSSDRPYLSDSGRFVSFFSEASSLVYGDSNGSADIFVRDRNTDITTRASVKTDGNQASGPANQFSALSDDGQVIVFDSYQHDIVTGDTNLTSDVFIGYAGANSPNNLHMTTKTTSSISLAWDDNSNPPGTPDVNMIVQRRRPNQSQFSDRQTLPANTTSFTDGSLNPCAIYIYRIMAVSSTGIRSPSNIIQVKTLGCPPGPFLLQRPLNGDLIINPERADFRWGLSEEAIEFNFALTRTSAPAGLVESRTFQAATICNDVRCIFEADAPVIADLINGTYSYTVFAHNNVPPDTPATNNPQTFTVNMNLPPRDFEMFAPAHNGLVRDIDTFPGFTWFDNKDADLYALDVIQISGNTRLGSVISQTALTPQIDGDRLNCDFDARVCGYTPSSAERAAMVDGTYTWTVTAISPGGARFESTDGAHTFTVNSADIEMLKNGGFEDDTNADGFADFWSLANGSDDKRKCNKPAKPPVTIFGNCAFVFRSSPTESSSITQVITDEGYGFIAGDEVQFGAQVKAGSLVTGALKFKLKIKYVGGVFSPDKSTINVAGGSYDWSATPTSTLIIDGAVSKISVKALFLGTSGKASIDQLSYLLLGPDSPRRRGIESNEFPSGTRMPLGRDGTLDGLLPPPPPVDGFRGQN